MAAGCRCRRRQRLRGGKRTGAGGADQMKRRGGIRNRVKLGAAESAVKQSSADSAETAWIYIRGCRLERAGLRFNSQGDVYVPDSEDEEERTEVSANGAGGVDLAAAVAADGVAGVDLSPAVDADGAVVVHPAPAVATDGADGVDLPPVVATDGSASVEMNAEVAARLAKKVLGEDLHPEVAALLAKVLCKMDPFCFIDMYKVMVPLFFRPPL